MSEYLTREEAEARFRQIENDFRNYQEANKNQPSEWWDDARMGVREQIRMMRRRFDELKSKAPDAWDEMKDGFNGAMHKLESGYKSAIRELSH